MFAPPPPPSKRSKEVQFSTNPMRNNNHSRTASAPQSTTPRPFDANRNAPPNPTNPKSKPRRMSSRELMKSRPPPPSNRGPPPPGSAFSKNPLKPKPPPPSKSKPSIPSTSSSTNRQKRAQTTGQKSNDSSLPQEIRTQSGSVVKLKITKSELNKNYRRGSVTDRYRRASIFNEIIKEQQKNKAAAAENGTAGSEQQHHRHHSSRVDMIQGTQNYGVNTQHRSRIMAFERVAHNEGVDHDDFIINPYCVASMPEPIRKAFVLKVCGIVLSQMLLMITVICIIKYSGLGAEIIKGYNMWSLLTTFIPLIFLAILMGVRKSHPWNLFVFSLFTLSWAYSLGIACVWLENRLFISVMGLTAMNTLSIMGFARYVDYGKLK